MLLTAAGAVSLLIWIYLLGFRGGFWCVSRHLPLPAPRKTPERRIAVVIPARNEAAVIGQAITSLLQQQFPSPLHIFIVDDASTDGTADVAALTAESAGLRDSLTIIPGKPLAPGWTGKLWALQQGVDAALNIAPDYLLLTDADVVHGRNSVPELVDIAEGEARDLACYMVKLACNTFAEKALIPAFVFFFLKLYPPSWIASKRLKTAAAAGGCILIRSEALQRIGGLESIRTEIIDDCALARQMKRAGGQLSMALTYSTVSIRSYGTFAEIGRMISRTAFNQLRHSSLLLIATFFGLFVTYLLPLLLLLAGERSATILGFAAWLLMSVAYLPMVRFYRSSMVWSLSLPLIATFYLGATIHSAVQYWRGFGGEWKGRVQDTRA